MMVFLRFLALLVGLVAAGYALAWCRTGNPRYLTIARRTFVVGVALALIFFAGMFIERLTQT